MEDNLIFSLLIQERPDGPEAKNWRVNDKKFDAMVRLAFKRFNVVGFFADPPYWMDWVDGWERDFGEQLVVAGSHESKIAFYTSRDTAMARALQRFKIALNDRRLKIIPNRRLVRHLQNAQKWTRARNLEVIGKASKNSPRKIDGAIAATLAHEARAKYLMIKDQENPPAKDIFVPVKAR